MDTAPLPRIPPEPSPWETPAARRSPAPERASGGLRVLEVLAGLLSGGLVTVGLGLVVLQLLAPELAPGTGLAAPAGPTWIRALAQLCVGLLGETAVLLRPRLSRAPRAWLAVAVIAAAAVTVYWAWLA